MPSSFSIDVVKPDGEPIIENPMEGTYMGQAYSKDLVKLAQALRRQSKLSSRAAIFASSSAILQIISFMLKIYLSNISV